MVPEHGGAGERHSRPGATVLLQTKRNTGRKIRKTNNSFNILRRNIRLSYANFLYIKIFLYLKIFLIIKTALL